MYVCMCVCVYVCVCMYVCIFSELSTKVQKHWETQNPKPKPRLTYFYYLDTYNN